MSLDWHINAKVQGEQQLTSARVKVNRQHDLILSILLTFWPIKSRIFRLYIANTGASNTVYLSTVEAIDFTITQFIYLQAFLAKFNIRRNCYEKSSYKLNKILITRLSLLNTQRSQGSKLLTPYTLEDICNYTIPTWPSWAEITAALTE